MDVREKSSNGKRLIDADRAMEIVRNQGIAHPNAYHLTNYATLILREAPTVDAVEVVRCRDCQHWKPSGSKAGNSFSDMEYIGGCEFTNYYRRESDFCSYGERKEGSE